MKTATWIKDLENWRGNARLYRLSEPVFYDSGETTKYVAVSAASVMFSGDETYIFPADEEGKVLDWGELTGSYQGGLSHEYALKRAGFEVVEK